MRIYIVRHGETNANRDGYLQGWSNAPLNKSGKMLAKITGQKLKDVKFDYCISSPLKRARETAEIILRESRNNIPITYDNRIKEINFGIFEGITVKDEMVIRFLRQPITDYKYPDGESISEVMERTQGFLRELINRDDGKTYLLSTHGCALRAMLNFLYEDPSVFWHGHVPYNCCLNILESNHRKVSLVADDMVLYDFEYIKDYYK